MKRVEEQPRQCLEKLKAIPTAGPYSTKIAKVTVLMMNIKDFARVSGRNGIYRAYSPPNPPARSCIEVKNLAREGLKLEIECVAAI